ncbi:MAG: FHA domain-containing protein [Pirellulaceae bacterium]
MKPMTDGKVVHAKLVIVGGEAFAKEIPLQLPAVIGRGRDVDVSLRDPLISRKHCELYQVGNEVYVRDLGSLNGTFVGNQRISDHSLEPGDLLTLGTITFRAVHGDYDDSSAFPLGVSTPVTEDCLGASASSGDPAESTILGDRTMTVAEVTDVGRSRSSG